MNIFHVFLCFDFDILSMACLNPDVQTLSSYSVSALWSTFLTARGCYACLLCERVKGTVEVLP
jgi:hypothetical protein